MSHKKSALVIDDDAVFCRVLSDALTARGFEAQTAHNSADSLRLAQEFAPEYTVLDLKIGKDSGLTLTAPLLEVNPYTRIVVLTGYASIATAVEAIKLGAVHYLAKPVEVDEIIAAFAKNNGNPEVPIDASPRTVLEVEWEHIRTIYDRNGGNISATARELRMHRRTLQRKLEKSPLG